MSKKNAKPYSEKIHIWGRISSITAIAALMLVPIAISAVSLIVRFPPM